MCISTASAACSRGGALRYLLRFRLRRNNLLGTTGGTRPPPAGGAQGREMLTLYNFHASSTSYRTRIVLNYKNIPYEYISVRLDKAEHLGRAYGEINPMRGVPTLDSGDACLYKSSAIIEYLEEVYTNPPM